MNNEGNKSFDWEKLAQHQRIGEILLQHGKITIVQLGLAIEEQKKNSLPIGQILINKGFIEKETLIALLNLQENIDKVLAECISELKNM